MSTSVRWPQLPPRIKSNEVYYPETDNKPMAESDLHRDMISYLIQLLQRFFAEQQVYVSGNLLIYYEQGNPRKSVAPDCFVVRSVDPHLRTTYKLWEEGKTPEVVFEVTSKSTQNDDLGKKMRLYAQLGVQEYYLYDPTADYLQPSLRAFQLSGSGYIPMQPTHEEVTLGDLTVAPNEVEAPEYVSHLLGLRITVDEGNRIQFYDLITGSRLLSDAEARAEAETEIVRLRAELAQLRGEA
ncbi:MAG: Uma2 family endonuclease [Caldilineaceae bacterium]